MLIELRGAEGRLESEWRLGIGDGGTESDLPDDGGIVRNRRIHQEGFRIRTKGRLIRHRHGVDDPADRWVVGVPQATLPRQRNPGPIDLTIVDRATRKPLAGAEVVRQDTPQPEAARTGADGQLTFRAHGRSGLLKLKITAPAHEARTVVLSTRDPVPRTVALDRWVDTHLTITATGDRRPIVSDGFVARADGRVLAQFKGNAPSLKLRKSDLDTAWIEVHVMVESEHRAEFAFRRHLVEGSTVLTVPESRILEVSVRNPEGHPVRNAQVRVGFSAVWSSEGRVALGEGSPAQVDGARTDEAGRAYVAVPTSSPYAVLVDAPQAAPIVRQFQAGDGNTPLEVIAERGLQVPVQVRGPDGRTLPGARVVARTSVGGLRVASHASTGRDGRADLGPLGPGPVEIFAWAPGHGWAAVVEAAAAAMGTVELNLPRGERLTLVVEDPFGIALANVRAEVTAADGGRPLVSPPQDVRWRSDKDGHLDIPDLPERLYDVTLTLPGFSLEKLEGVRPGATKYFVTLVRKP